MTFGERRPLRPGGIDTERVAFLPSMRVTLWIVIIALSVGCRPPVDVPDAPSYAGDVEPLVVKRCLSCHEFEEPKAQLVLEVGEGYGRMVGRSSTQVKDVLIVAPGDVEGSYLWHKLDFTAAEGQGMPRTAFGARRLPDDEVELFRRWIETGAKP
jgi:hypothetical protein